MSTLRSFRRKLDPYRVAIAKDMEQKRLVLARQVVLERAKKDAEFAADVLKAVGENLPKEIKEACEETLKNQPIVGGDETYKLTKEVQLDGGGTILVDPNEEILDGLEGMVDALDEASKVSPKA